MKKRVLFIFGIMVLITSQVLALSIGNNIPIQIQTTDSSGNIITGTFNFTINISNSDTCTPVLHSNTTTKTTDVRGIISYNLENITLGFDEQYWFCYYRDGILKEVAKIARTPYSFRTKNITLSGVEIDTSFNLSDKNITTTGYGFFNKIGSLLNRITKLFVIDIDANGTVNISGDLRVDTDTLFVNATSNRVGIGIASPSQKLDVAGNINISGTTPYLYFKDGGYIYDNGTALIFGHS